MLTVYPILGQRMNEHGISCKELASIAGMSRFSLYLTMWGIRKWRLTEAVKICAFFKTPNAEKVFVRKHFKSQ